MIIDKDFKFFHPNNGHGFTTRDGRQVRIYCADADPRYPVHGAAYDESIRAWNPVAWTHTGAFYSDGIDAENRLDIIVPIKKFKIERWFNIVHSNDGFTRDGFYTYCYHTKEDADEHDPNRIACYRQVFEGTEGDGIE